MMEYSIGSVADLISGSATPNKRKVVKKQIKNKSPSPLKNQRTPTTAEVSADIKKPMKKRTKKQSVSPQAKRLRPVTETPNISNSDSDEGDSSEDEFTINPKINTKEFSGDEESDDESDVNEEIEGSSDRSENESDVNVKNASNDFSDGEESESESEEMKDSSEEEESEDESDVKEDADESSDSEESEDESNVKVQVNTKQLTKPENTHTTIFVGNLPVSVTHNKLKKLFTKFGKVENARIRSIPVADPAVPKKVAAIKKQFHPDRKSLHGYVSFTNREDALKALSFNGREYEEHHIRVNMCDESQKPDRSKAIFLGNVSFAAEEEELWKLFQSCGEIESVRLVRDRRTDIGKGFGYINFKSSDSVELALQMGEVKLRDRVLRVSLYNGKAPKKAKPQKGKPFNKQKNESNLEKTDTNGQFQGKTASQKKNKFHKGNQQKKKLAQKIAPKTASG